ncbi:S-adenosyl-L-methionine-dependent methyltransferase [Diaporthe sp. PMI_573]|nr:S-adenosyl-L-methionine-dependent methyltransferase [Diaporthaceae sp. PMI_573]
MSDSNIAELAAQIAANTTIVNDFYTQNEQPTPTFDHDAPLKPVIPPGTAPEIEAARQAVIYDCQELRILMQGPAQYLASLSATELVGIQGITRFGLDKKVPIGGEATFEELATHAGIGEAHMCRMLRLAIAQHIFQEIRPGVVAHTAASRLLAEDEPLHQWMAPDRLRRFADMMRLFSRRPGVEAQHVVKGYPWGDLPDGATVVDVGGSHGDLDEDVIRASEGQRPADLTDRVRYQVHDFMTEQPVKEADVYFFRAIFHNWSHKYALQILRNLVPALKPGAKIVMADYVIPTPDKVPKSQEAAVSTGIVSMNVLFNSANREMEEWTRLFVEADPRFDFKGGSQPLGSDLWVLEADWK